MSSESILDQILSNQKAEQVAELDAVEIINDLFGELTEREKDVVIKRHGLHGREKETLESIGQAHNLTRERIRQIETHSINKLQQLKNVDVYIKTLKKVISQLLEEHGGIMEKDYLLSILAVFSLNGFGKTGEEEIIHKNYLNFLITKLLFNEFEEINSSKYFKNSYKLKHKVLDDFEKIIEELLGKIKEAKTVHRTEELIKLINSLESYNNNTEKFAVENNLDISRVLGSDFFEENGDLINNNKVLYSILKAAKKIEQNKFGHWGMHNWHQIKPKTINDKICLVLKNYNRPMHFEKIAEKINSINFDKKKANAATVHNELILDNKYVLIGRGIYSLKEWGYKDGTVVDVIIDIMAGSDEPISREEIIDKVLEKRLVKKATIILALMNKDKFAKINGKYILKN
ncbi:MAG: sigma factor-like helix-turn-helix DNA-binding protein [Patescibacteria group bacterium]|nr:sigma factor-like helix-turn-helix DNA-binding protein [Patescibacteria group bacterium]